MRHEKQPSIAGEDRVLAQRPHGKAQKTVKVPPTVASSAGIPKSTDKPKKRPADALPPVARQRLAEIERRGQPPAAALTAQQRARKGG